MVPGAIGSQTNGSVIRPAAFCGVVGFKPTHGLIPRSGALLLSRALDHVGVFARTVEDAALLAETLAGFDEEDPDTRPVARPPLRRRGGERAAAAAALRLRALAGLDARRAGDARGVRRAGRGAGRAGVPRSSSAPSFERALDLHRTVMEVEMAHNLHRDYEQGGDQLSPVLRAADRARPRRILAIDYTRAAGRQRAAQRGARRRLRRVRRHPHAGRAGRGAARPRQHRQPGVLHAPGPISARRP